MSEELKETRKKKQSLGSYISGNILANEGFIRRLPVLAFVGLLMLLYMANGFSVQQKHNRVDELTEQIKELRTISITTAAVRMSSTRQTEIEKLLKQKNIPLIQIPTSPKIIKRSMPVFEEGREAE